MSYAQVMARVEYLQSRLGVTPKLGNMAAIGFDRVLATANNRFEQGPERINTPLLTTPTMATNRPADPFWDEGGFAMPDPQAPFAAAARSAGGAAGGRIGDLIDTIAARHHVPAALVKAVARAESGFRADAVSPAGAQGVMQLMPATARGLGVSNPLDAAQNIDGGVRYLKQQLQAFNGDVRLALAAYNAGPGNVRKYGGIPPFAETQRYVPKVLAFAREYGFQSGRAA